MAFQRSFKEKADTVTENNGDKTATFKQPTANGWISVKDRLPDTAGIECLVCAVNKKYNQTHVITAYSGYDGPGWWTTDMNYMSGPYELPRNTWLHPSLKVTHWMHLPEPPKEDDNEAD